MRALIIGGGGREHAIAWKVAQSARVSEVHVAPGNGGTAHAEKMRNVAIAVTPSFDEVIAHCRAAKIDLVIVGPEASLVEGIVDALDAESIPCFGPTRAAARLEGSKAFTREIAQAAGVPSYEYGVFDDAEPAQAFLRGKSEPWWIKADGLAAGKGAVLPESIDAGCALLRDWLGDGTMGEAGRRVVIEQPLRGTEASVIAICDGESLQTLVPSQDHKRLLDGDEGPNTGGMGAFAPTPHLTLALLSAVKRDFLQPTLRVMAERGSPFRGFLYAGIMLTADGPRLLEYNVRLGDPEAQVILPLLENDFVDVIEATLAGRLSSITLKTIPGAAVTVVAAAEGYPASPRKGDPISGLERAAAVLGERGVVFHAGTKEQGETVVTNGGRVLSVTALGESMGAARDLSHAALGEIHFPGKQHRTDIAAHL